MGANLIKSLKAKGRGAALLGSSFACLFALNGCVAPPQPRNVALTQKLVNVELLDPGAEEDTSILQNRYDFDAWLAAHHKHLPKHAIIITMSGGGTRAASLSQAVILMLSQYKTGPGKTLADNIIAVSGVSGGSMTAATYALDGVKGLGSQYESQVLKHSLLDTVALGGLANPLKWTDRAEVLGSFLDKAEFNKRQYSALTQGENLKRAPFLFLNSTDIVTGRIFSFTQRQFGDLCSDLNAFMISDAVTASSNFPFASTDIELRNFQSDNGSCGDPSSHLSAIAASTPYVDLNAATENRYRMQMTEVAESDPLDKPSRPIAYLHLFDGGLADNLGIRPVIRTLNHQMLSALAKYGVEDIELIQVNARSDPNDPLNTSSGSPRWVLPLLTQTSYGPIDRVTALSTTFGAERLDVLFARRVQDSSKRENPDPFPKALYPIVIDFDQIADEKFRNEVKSIETQTALNEITLAEVQKAGRMLLTANPCFKRFKEDLAKAGDEATYVPSALDDIYRFDPKEGPGSSLCERLVPDKLSLSSVDIEGDIPLKAFIKPIPGLFSQPTTPPPISIPNENARP